MEYQNFEDFQITDLPEGNPANNYGEYKGSMSNHDKVYMNDDLYAVLMGLWKKRRQQKWVFYNPDTGTRYKRRQKLMRSVCARAFAPGVKVKDYYGPVYGFHALRHFVGSYLDDTEKVGTKTVSKLLRHQRVATTERYLHSLGVAEMMALKKLEGRFE